MVSLFYLYQRILVNEYRKKFFFKSTVFGAAVLIILSIITLGLGFVIGYLVNYSRLHPELKLGDAFYGIKLLFLEVAFPVIVLKAASGMNSFRLINLNSLRIFPVTKFAIFSFDINVGLFDFMSLYFAEFLIGLIAGAGGFTISIPVALVFIFFLISIVYFVHILGEMVRSIKMLLSSLPKRLTVTVTIISVSFLYFIFFKNLTFKTIVNNNPLSWNASSVFSLTIFNETNWILNNIALNILFSITGLIIIVFIKTLHDKLFSTHIIRTTPKLKKKKPELPKIVSLFPQRLQPYLDKDLKYLLRSSRSVSAVIMELLLLVLLGYMHVIHSKLYSNTYLALGLILCFPAIIWDFYLSNSWGLEKRGFGFYLYSNADFKSLIPSKNIVFLFFKLPVLLVISIGFGIIYSFKYVPVIILLYIILYLTSLMFTNIVSIKNPYPLDFKESPFARRQPQRISRIGFAGLSTYMALIGASLFAQYKLQNGVVFYLIGAGVFIFLLFIYKKVLLYSSLLLNRQKELIYKDLIKT